MQEYVLKVTRYRTVKDWVEMSIDAKSYDEAVGIAEDNSFDDTIDYAWNTIYDDVADVEVEDMR